MKRQTTRGFLPALIALAGWLVALERYGKTRKLKTNGANAVRSLGDVAVQALQVEHDRAQFWERQAREYADELTALKRTPPRTVNIPVAQMLVGLAGQSVNGLSILSNETATLSFDSGRTLVLNKRQLPGTERLALEVLMMGADAGEQNQRSVVTDFNQDGHSTLDHLAQRFIDDEPRRYFQAFAAEFFEGVK